MLFELTRWAHTIGASVLLGTGAGIAFFMLMAHRSRDAHIIAHTSTIVVIADWLFTASAVIAQPITGILLSLQMGWSLTEGWILASIALYIFTGMFWLPVVWIQYQLRNMARQAARDNAPLPPRYDKLFTIWFICGFPAFFSVLFIFWLMIARPSF